MIYKNLLKYIIFIFFTKIYSDNHKLITFFGGKSIYNILSLIQNNDSNPFEKEICIYIPLKKDNKNIIIEQIYASPLKNQKLTEIKTYTGTYIGNSQYKGNPIETFINNENKKLQLPDFNNIFQGISFNYSFDEVMDGIYAGLSLFSGSIENKIIVEYTSELVVFHSKYEIPFAIGGYFQIQNGENDDYSFFGKLSVLVAIEQFGFIKIDNSYIIDNKIQLGKLLKNDMNIGLLVLSQIGGKIDCLELSLTIGVNFLPKFKYSYNTSETNINTFTLFAAISIGFLFK